MLWINKANGRETLMMFASDLDRTLIYSKKSMMLPDNQTVSFQLIEKKEEKEISFMTDHAISLLQKLAKEMLFVPVTTRTIEQYERISLFHHSMKVPYAITSNGGNILIDGKIDVDWNNRVVQSIKDQCLPKSNVLNAFSDISHDEWVLKAREADDLFCYFIIDPEKVPECELGDFRNWLSNQGWDSSLQGRKLYFVPKPVNKWRAVNYIKEREEKSFLFAAGDSQLDYDMLKMADMSYAPLHGELKYVITNEKYSSNIKATNSKGILASEELLQNIILQIPVRI